MNRQELNAAVRAVQVVEGALFSGGWAPRRVIILADVIDAHGDELFIGCGTEGITEKDVLKLLAHTLAGMTDVQL